MTSIGMCDFLHLFSSCRDGTYLLYIGCYCRILLGFSHNHIAVMVVH